MLLSLLPLLAACEGSLPEPPGRRGARGALVDGQLWTIGGEDEGGLTAAVWSYDLGDQLWQRRGDAPEAMAWGGVGWDGAAMIVLAGETPAGISDRVWRLDPRTDSWNELAPMPEPRSRFASVMAGQTLMLTGGRGPNDVVYGDAWSLTDGVWNEVSPWLGVGGFADATLLAGDSAIFQVSGTLALGWDYLFVLEGDALVVLDVGLGSLPGACGLGDGGGFWLWPGTERGGTWRWNGYWETVEADAAPIARGYALCVPLGDSLYVLGGDPSFGLDSRGFVKDLWRLRDGTWKAVLDVNGRPVEEP